MKSYIPHRILVINDQVVQSALDETLFECYRLAFKWANDMGLQGKKVFDLFLEKPKYDGDPMNIPRYYLWCKIECTEDERKIWDDQNKLNIAHAVFNSFVED